MNLFDNISKNLSNGECLTIVARKASDDKMTVSVLPSSADKAGIAPFILTGSPAELDEGFADAIAQPLAAAAGLSSTGNDFVEAVTSAKKKAAKKDAPKKPKDADKPKDKPEEAAAPAEEKPATETAPAEQTAEAPADNNGTKETPASETEGVTEKTADAAGTEQENEVAPAEQEEPKAPTAQEEAKEDVRDVYRRGTEAFKDARYQDALNLFTRSRELATENMYPTIDKAIAACKTRLGGDGDLFNS